MRGSPPFGWFVLLSIVLHIVVVFVVGNMPLKKEKAEPVVYTVGIVEEPKPPPPVIRQPVPPPPPVIREPIPPPQAPPATKTLRVPPPKTEREMSEETVPPQVPERAAAEPPEEVAAAPPAPGVPEAPSLPALPDREGVPPPDKGVPGAEKPPSLPKDGIFDRDVVRMFAKKEEAPPIVKPEDTITFDTEEFKYKKYMERLKETIEGIWEYPQSASRKGIYGDLVIEFVIKKNGKLGSVRVMRTSGYSDLDEAAVKALRDAEPYIWPFPEGWDIDVMNIRGHFIYTIYGMRIR